MTQRFDRQKLFANITTLIQQHGYKVGEVETSIGVSQGYLSRLVRGDSSPSAELIWQLAKLLDVNMELLIDGDFARLAPGIEYLQKFIQRLLQETMHGQLSWTSCSLDDIKASLSGEATRLPIVQETGTTFIEDEKKFFKQGGYDRGTATACGNRRIRSFTRPRSVVLAADSYFFADIQDGQRLYIFKFAEMFFNKRHEVEMPTEWYELVFRIGSEDSNEYEPVTNTLFDGELLLHDVEALYQELKHHEDDLTVTDSARSIIDGFMGRPKPTQRHGGIQVISDGIKV